MLFSSHKRSKTIALFDVGSSSIGASVVSYIAGNKGEVKPVFMSAIRDHFSFQEELDFKRFALTMESSVEKTLATLKSLPHPKVSEVFCILSSPWYTAEMRVVELKKSTEFIATKQVLDDLVKKEIKRFEESELTHYGNLGSELVVVESKISHIRLNGYPSEDPIGKMCSSISLELYIVIAPKSVLKKIEYYMQKTWNGVSVRFLSYGYVAFSVIRDLFPTEHSFLVVDIGGEVSDIMLVKQNTIHSSVSFPYGKHTLIRALSREFKLAPSEFLSIAEAYRSGDLSYEETERLAGALKNAEKEWLEYFQKGLVNISNEISVPPTLFVTADNKYIDWFMDFIKRETFTQYTATERAFTIVALTSTFLESYVNVAGVAKKDPLLLLESLFVRKLL